MIDVRAALEELTKKQLVRVDKLVDRERSTGMNRELTIDVGTQIDVARRLLVDLARVQVPAPNG